MSKESNLVLIRQLLKSAENSVKSAMKLMDEIQPEAELASTSPEDLQEKASHLSVMEGGKIVEGVFDGQNMVGPDGRIFPVPANYASKSKLVEGDILKLTIADDGTFIFKQIGPVERKKVIGTIIKDDNGDYRIQVGDKMYKVLLASVTYFKAEVGDEVTVIVPRDKESMWVAVENIIKKTDANGDAPAVDVAVDVSADEEFKPVDIESEDDGFKDVNGDEDVDSEEEPEDALDQALDKDL